MARSKNFFEKILARKVSIVLFFALNYGFIVE